MSGIFLCALRNYFNFQLSVMPRISVGEMHDLKNINLWFASKTFINLRLFNMKNLRHHHDRRLHVEMNREKLVEGISILDIRCHVRLNCSTNARTSMSMISLLIIFDYNHGHDLAWS